MYSSHANWNNILVPEEEEIGQERNKTIAMAERIMNLSQTNWNNILDSKEYKFGQEGTNFSDPK
jgi:hypothetical protein